MADESNPLIDRDEPTIYQIRIQGQLDQEWTDWFDGLTITVGENGQMVLTGPVVDQAALYGLLKKVRDLGMPLASVTPVGPGPSTALPSTTLGTGETGGAGSQQ
jgi:hypothetical protein